VAGNQVAAEAIRQAQGLFQVHRAGLGQTHGAGEGLGGDIDAVVAGGLLDHGETDAVVGDGVTQGHVRHVQAAGFHGEPEAGLTGGQMGDATDGRDDTGKHGFISENGG